MAKAKTFEEQLNDLGIILSPLTTDNESDEESAKIAAKEREEFIENRLSLEAIGGATFQRNTYSTLIPSLLDMGLYYSGNDTMFNYRSSGLETNLWTGNPTYALVENWKSCKMCWSSYYR